MNSKRYTVERISNHECRLRVHQPCLLGEVGGCTTYWRPANGGYVYDTTDHPGTSGHQVCERLCSTGATLRQGGAGDLAALIRREAVKALRIDEGR